MGEEIELKLEVAESAIPALLKCAALKRRGVRFRPARRLVTTYYDTAKGALRRKGIFLRIRQDGRRITQTVKTAGQGGVLAERGEWDWPLTAAEPDLGKAEQAGLKPLAKRARKGGVKPVFASDFARRIALVDEVHTRLELALDRGIVRAGRRTAPFSELEIEVKAGPPAAVFSLARDLVVLPGLRIGTLTKAARGFALAAGRPVEAVKADDPDLSAGMTLAQAEAAIIRSCAAQMAANLPAVIDRRLPEGVHQMRVALRRLRAALSLFKETMPAEDRKALRRQAGAFAKTLGPARDLDVLIAGPLKEAVAPRELVLDLKALSVRLSRMRREAWQAVLTAVAAPGFGLLVLDLSERAVLLGADSSPALRDAVPLAEMAREALDERHEIVLALGHSIDTLSVLQRHELRLALKKLRYAADFFCGLYSKKDVRSGLKSLSALQDALGGFNDAASAAALLDRAVASTPARSRAPVERAALFLKVGFASRRPGLGPCTRKLGRLRRKKAILAIEAIVALRITWVREPETDRAVLARSSARCALRRDRSPQERRPRAILHRQAFAGRAAQDFQEAGRGGRGGRHRVARRRQGPFRRRMRGCALSPAGPGRGQGRTSARSLCGTGAPPRPLRPRRKGQPQGLIRSGPHPSPACSGKQPGAGRYARSLHRRRDSPAGR